MAVGATVTVTLIATGASPVSATEADYFTIAVVPDTQFTAANYPEILDAQFDYLRDHRDELKLGLVLQAGDVVNTMSSDTEWANARNAYAKIDGLVPFTVAAGNHDLQDYQGAAAKSSSDPLTPAKARNIDALVESDQSFLRKMGRSYPTVTSRFDTFLDGLDSYEVDGRYKPGSYANTYQLVDLAGGKYLVMNLQFGAPAPVLAWASGVAKANADRYVILLTHDYLNQKGQVRGTPGNGSESSLPKAFDPALANPNTMWEKFVKTNPNVKLTFSGHVNTKTAGTPYAVGKRKAKNAGGKYVYSMLANYQMFGRGGEGYIRLVKIYPSTKRMEVTTFSPFLGTYLTDAGNKFIYTDVNLAALGGSK